MLSGALFSFRSIRTGRTTGVGLAAVEFVTGVEGDESEAWTYFRGPDGCLYELWQTTRRLNTQPPK
jgi:hypothetical protein